MLNQEEQEKTIFIVKIRLNGREKDILKRELIINRKFDADKESILKWDKLRILEV